MDKMAIKFDKILGKLRESDEDSTTSQPFEIVTAPEDMSNFVTKDIQEDLILPLLDNNYNVIFEAR